MKSNFQLNNSKVIVTGGLGFIGSNFILNLFDKFPNCKITNLDAEFVGSNKYNLKEITKKKNYQYSKGNISDIQKTKKLIKDCDVIFNFAAESHVDRSIDRPKPFFDSNINKLNRDKIGHANSVTIYRFQKDGEDHYLCLRTEPHRHTNIYCRNSVRKAIRDIFKYLNNSHYLDFIIDSREGLQVNEEEDIEKQNLTDFDNIPQNIQNLSPLQGNSGFCASWTIYTLFVLMTNRNLNLEYLGKYFANFNLRNPERQTISKFKSELDKCYLNDKKDSSCKSKEIFEREFKKYIDYDSGTGRYYIPNETQQKNYSYILTKQIKLYRMIIFVFYFITKKLKISELFDNIQNENDKKIINEIFNKFDTIKILDILNDKLEFQNKLKITITQDVLDKDTHLCDDNMFDHKEFCNINDIVKSIPNPDNYNCNINKLKENNNIRLRGLQSTLNEEKTQTDSIIKDINYIFQKL